jgi:hypothetical protein
LTNLIFTEHCHLPIGEVVVPHVVLYGKVAVEDIFRELKPLFIRNESTILRTTEVYLERGKKALLVDSLAIEGSKKLFFL